MSIVINFIECASNTLRLVEQLTCALRTRVFKAPHFQLLGAKEYQFIYKSVRIFFKYCSFNLPGFLIVNMSRKRMALSISISIANVYIYTNN